MKERTINAVIDRVMLLEAASEVVKVFGETFNKGQLERWISKGRDEEDSE